MIAHHSESYGDKLIDVLRKEASEVKDCASRYILQGLAFASVILAAMIGCIPETPYVAFAAIPIIFLLKAISKTSIHKYGTANRNLGYQLHIERSKILPDSADQYGWQREYMNIGWEEAMRAWRVIQATVFSELYDTGKEEDINNKENPYQKFLRRIGGSANPEKLKTELDESYCWFIPSRNLKKPTQYHPGVFLRSTIKLLHSLSLFVCAIAFIGGIYLTIINLFRSPAEQETNYPTSTLEVIVLIFFLAISGTILFHFVWREIKWDNRRIDILENELLSIHSCSIVWQAVVVAHYRAMHATLGDLQDRQKTTLKGFTTHLSKEAKMIKRYAKQIHDYIGMPFECLETSGPREKRLTLRRYLLQHIQSEICVDGKLERNLLCDVIQVEDRQQGILAQTKNPKVRDLYIGQRVKLIIEKEQECRVTIKHATYRSVESSPSAETNWFIGLELEEPISRNLN